MDNILLRSAKYYEDLKVDIILSTRVERVDVEHKTLMRQDGVETAFDKLFIATGCKPKRLSPEIPGKKLIFFFFLCFSTAVFSSFSVLDSYPPSSSAR